jgi:hypothetical protein
MYRFNHLMQHVLRNARHEVSENCTTVNTRVTSIVFSRFGSIRGNTKDRRFCLVCMKIFGKKWQKTKK